MTTPTTTKRKPRKQPEAETPESFSAAAITAITIAQERAHQWERRFNFIASLDPIAYKHFYRTVQRSGMTVAEVVDSQCGSFLENRI